MSGKPLKIGLVGLGGMGTVHLSNYAHLSDCSVAAICDPSPLAKETGAELGIPVYDRIEDMLAGGGLDVADVCTPTFLHRDQVMTALEAGLHVICEKPLTLALADAEAMYTLAEEKGVLLLVGQVLQYSPATKVLRELVQSGRYGKVLDAQFLRLSPCPRWVKNGWLFDKSKSGHLPYDLHIHDLDLMISLFGNPDEFSFTSNGRRGLTYKEHYRFSYRFGDATVSAEAAWYNADIPFTATWRVYFEEAVVLCDGEHVTAYQFDHAPAVFDTEEKLKIPTGINLPPTGIFHEELGEFLNLVRTAKGGPSPRKEEILTLIEILEQIAGECDAPPPPERSAL